MTTEAIAWIRVSDKVLYLAHDPVAHQLIAELKPGAESLADCYGDGKLRRQSYQQMVERVLEHVRSGQKTCLVFYGHPGVFCWPGHEAIRQARCEGYTAWMLPAVSAEDCLFADLNIDPGTHGCISYEATDFLKNGRHADPTCLLMLWQVGAVGDLFFRTRGCDLSALPLLVDRLCRVYGGEHQGILYSAPIQWGGKPSVEHLRLRHLGQASLSASATLCVLPSRTARPNAAVAKVLKLLPSTQAYPGSPRRAPSKRKPSGVPRPVQPHQRRPAR
jgi:hypothetical protein